MITINDKETEPSVNFTNLTVGSDGNARALATVINGQMVGVVIGEFDPTETTDQAFERLIVLTAPRLGS